MEWRRYFAGWFSAAAVIWLVDGTRVSEVVAAFAVGGAVYCALGYLRKGN